jgi:hypothetical protein
VWAHSFQNLCGFAYEAQSLSEVPDHDAEHEQHGCVRDSYLFVYLAQEGAAE